MLYIPKIDDYLEISIDEDVKDCAAINFREYIKEKQNIRKVAKSLYFFLTMHDSCMNHYNVEVLNLFDPEL